MNKLMPVLFVGHGSPMNAIEKNEFSNTWAKVAQSIPRPDAVLCISAHWETNETEVTAMPKPKTIHDFGGFPQELFDVQYPAPGSPELAEEIIRTISKFNINADKSWGLDHGCWSVIRCMYSKADIPVLQLSLNYAAETSFHYELAKELFFLREKKILIIGSGNIVHNLRLIDWEMEEGGAEWAVSANNLLKELINSNDHQKLIDYKSLGKEVQLGIPTPEHYLPLLYALALKQPEESITYFNDKLVLGSMSMTSLKIG
jgi:4,5-DOPA dioxygenase extradiol